jgi:hypothetical protein
MTRIRTCALAIAVVCFIGGQASAQQALQGGPHVTVVNPTDLAAANAHALGVGTPVAFFLAAPRGTTFFTVPTGQRLVIEYVSGQCDNSPQNIPPLPIISTVTSGTFNDHTIAMPFAAAAIQTVRLGQVVKIYADPGTRVQLTVKDAADCLLTFSGQLVNTP